MGCVANVGIVVQNRVEAALIFPAMEDVPDIVRDRLPVVVSLFDHLEEGNRILCLFEPASRDTGWRGRKRSEVRWVEAAIDRTRQRSVRSNDQIVIADFLVEDFCSFRSADRQEDEKCAPVTKI